MSNTESNQEEVVKTTISMPEDLLHRGKRRAKAQRRSFSGHLQFLLEEDLREQPLPEPQPSTQEVGA